MSLLRRIKITWARSIAVTACLVALAAYAAVAPPRSHADDEMVLEGGGKCECIKNGQVTTEGGCVGGQTCSCIHGEPANTCTSCQWNSGCS